MKHLEIYSVVFHSRVAVADADDWGLKHLELVEVERLRRVAVADVGDWGLKRVLPLDEPLVPFGVAVVDVGD